MLQSFLCPPGNGVYTVTTASDKKARLHQALYGVTDSQAVQQKWQSALETLGPNANVLLGVCSDCGGGILRGANWGPVFIRLAMLDLQGTLPLTDIGDIHVIPHLLHDKYLNESTLKSCRKALYGNVENAYPVSPLSITEAVCQALYTQNVDRKIVALGGDHSVSYPLVKAYLQAKQAAGRRVALIHFDAHTDLLVDRLGIDICFGSWTTHVLPYLTDSSDCIQIGIRATGKPKAYWQNTFGIQQFWAQEIKAQGADTVARAIIDDLTAKGIEELYVSFDIDAIDAEFVSATGTPESGGMAPLDALTIIKALKSHFVISGADLVEVAPFIANTHAGTAAIEPDSTLKVAAEIALELSQ